MGITCFDRNNNKNQVSNNKSKNKATKLDKNLNNTNQNETDNNINKGKKEEKKYYNFDLKNKNYYLICPECHKCLPGIITINYEPKKNDFEIIYKCQCNMRKSKNILINFISTKKPSNANPKEMKNYLDTLMKEGKQKADEFDGFEIIKNINKTFLKESKIYSTPTPLSYKCIKTILCNEKVFSLIKLKNHDLILAGTDKGKIFIRNFEDDYIIKEIQAKGSVICLLEFEENFILAGTSENCVDLWNIQDNNFNYNFIGHEGWVNSLVKYNDEIFASASNDGTIRIWNYKEKKFIKMLYTDSSVLSLIKLKNGNLCSSGDDNLINIWDYEKGECIYNLIGHQNRVRCICQLEDGTFLSGDDDNKIIVWKNNNIFKIILDGHKNKIRTLCQIDSNHFASGSIDNTIKIWNCNSFKCIQALESKDGGHTSNVTNIIKLGTNIFASGSSDKTIKIWKN